MSNSLAGKDALVLGGGAVGDALAKGFAALGAKVARSVAETSGSANLVVIPVVDPGGLKPQALADMDEAEWIRRCEAPLGAVRTALQEAHAVLNAKGGSIFLLVPTISLVGQADFVPFATVGEGTRSLAKAAARGWGAAGITVNCLALTQEQLAPGAEGKVTETRVPPALKTPDLEHDVAAFIAAMANGPQIATGTTIMVDGGNQMSV